MIVPSLSGSPRLKNDCSHGQARRISDIVVPTYCRNFDIKDSSAVTLQISCTFLPIQNTLSVNSGFSNVKSKANAANGLHGQLGELFAGLSPLVRASLLHGSYTSYITPDRCCDVRYVLNPRTLPSSHVHQLE